MSVDFSLFHDDIKHSHTHLHNLIIIFIFISFCALSMPRKRAKQATRLAHRSALEHNLAPQSKRRGEWGDAPRKAIELFSGPPSKRRAEDESAPPASIPELKIRPGERIRDFNQRVEQEFAHDIYASMRTNQRSESNQKKRQRRRERLKAKKQQQRGVGDASDDEFERAPSARPLHDVAQAPPVLTARPKERAPNPMANRPKPSPARQRILDEERKRVIEQYRAQKRS